VECGRRYGKKSWNEDYSNLAGDGRLLVRHGFLCPPDRRRALDAPDETHRRVHARTWRWSRATLPITPNVGLGNDFSYPAQFRLDPHQTSRSAGRRAPKHPPSFTWPNPCAALIRWYRRSGDERFLELCRKFHQFRVPAALLGRCGRAGTGLWRFPGPFLGHFHGTLAALRGLLDYALVADDYRL